MNAMEHDNFQQLKFESETSLGGKKKTTGYPKRYIRLGKSLTSVPGSLCEINAFTLENEWPAVNSAA